MLPVLISVGCVFTVIGIAAGMIINNYIQKLQKDTAHRTAEKIRSDAEREAEHLLRDARVSAKGEAIKMREECEEELRERRREQTNNEKRLAAREEVLDRRIEAADAKLKNVEKREKDLLLDYYEKYERIQRQISGLDSGLQTSVLSLRYLDCKMFSDIAYDLGYSESYIWHVHQKALKNFGRRYLDGDKESRKKQI